MTRLFLGSVAMNLIGSPRRGRKKCRWEDSCHFTNTFSDPPLYSSFPEDDCCYAIVMLCYCYMLCYVIVMLLLWYVMLCYVTVRLG